jgi:hypothetical protein
MQTGTLSQLVSNEIQGQGIFREWSNLATPRLNQGNKSRSPKSGGPMGWNASVDLALTTGCSAGETARDRQKFWRRSSFMRDVWCRTKAVSTRREDAATNDRPAALLDKSNHKLGLLPDDRSPRM